MIESFLHRHRKTETRPNFFIIGAPKCGTTALYEYLRTHPHVFMSPVKEPNYFLTDMPSWREFYSESEYLALFRRANVEHDVCGEASILYMFSLPAMKQVRDFAPDAKIVIILRNPIEVVQAWHGTCLLILEECEADFERAWALQRVRRQGRSLPPRCREPRILQYGDIGSFGHHLQRVYEVFDRRQVMVLLLDDLRVSPQQTYGELLKFLRIPSDGRTSFPRINESARLRSTLFQRLIDRHAIPAWLRRYGRKFGLHRLHQQLVKLNIKSARRSQIRPEFRKQLRDHFSDDIELLGSLLDRDLSSWLE